MNEAMHAIILPMFGHKLYIYIYIVRNNLFDELPVVMYFP